MRYAMMIMSLMCGMVLFGCDPGETTTTAPPPVDGTAGPGGAADAATVDAAKQEAAGAVKQAQEAGSEAVSAIQGEAQKLLDQAMEYIKDNKFELAEQAIVQLEGMKQQLPPTMQQAVSNARSALDTAKKAQGAIPGGLPR